MKHILKLSGLVILALAICIPLEAQVQRAPVSAPFSKGMVLAEWFETPGVEAIEINLFNEEDFKVAKSMGMDVLRLPIDFISMSSGNKNYTIPPLLFQYIDQAVDWAEKHQLYIIIDNHRLNMPATPNNIDSILIPLWTQIANHFKDRGDYVIYEILNEPHTIAANRWGKIQGDVISAIRKIDQRHKIIVGGVNYNSLEDLDSLPKYSDNNLIYTFHFYEPYLFTYQTDYDLKGVPWPYDRGRMPSMPNKISQYGKDLYKNYEKNSSMEYLASKLDKVAAFSIKRNVPVYTGEFGAVWYSNPEDRNRWHRFIVQELNKRNISWTAHQYAGGGFGIMFNALFGPRNLNADLNVELLSILRFTPPQQTQTPVSVRTGFTIFDDSFNKDFYINFSYHANEVNKAEYRNNTAAEGQYSIRWGNVNLYEAFTINFRRTTDLSQLVTAGNFLEFKARADKDAVFDVRFMNLESPNSPPWRMKYTVSVPADGQWHTIRVRLRDMEDQGGWSNLANQWVNSRKEFSWKNVTSLQFVPENNPITGNVWIDSIKIVAQ